MPEGEGEEQEIENVFENIMKENFPNLVKEIDFQEVQEAQSPKEVGPKNEHTKTRRGWREVFKVMKGKDLHPR